MHYLTILASASSDLTATDILLRLAAGLVIGFAIGLTGVGGGVLVMPALTKLFGFQPSLAVPTANFLAVLVKAHATYEHWKLDHVRRRTVIWFLVGGVPADLVVTGVLRLNKTRQWIATSTLETSLHHLVIAAMAVAAVAAVVKFIIQAKKKPEEDEKSVDISTGAQKAQAALCGALIGFLIGATSVGGGVLVIPMLAVVFGLSSKDTVGTSIGISIFLALISALFYFVGNADVPYAVSLVTACIMFVGAIPGVMYGSRLADKMNDRALLGIVVALILIAIAGMLFGSAVH